MNGNPTLSTFSMEKTEKPTNQDLSVVFHPASTVARYEYVITKDGVSGSPITITGAVDAPIYLLESGEYQITVNTYDATGALIEVKKSGTYVIDKEKPRINVGERSLVMEQGSTLKPLEGIVVTDNHDGNMIDQVTTNYDSIDFETLGIKTLTYTVTDQAGNTATESITINVVESTSNQLQLTQVSIIAVLLIVIFVIMQYRHTMELEKRIAKYALEPLVDDSKSIFDKLLDRYFILVQKVSHILEKSVFIKRFATRYEKYAGTITNRYKKGIYFVASKAIIAILFLLIAVFAKTLQ